MRHYGKGIGAIAAVVLLTVGTVWFFGSRPRKEKGSPGAVLPAAGAALATAHPERRDFTVTCRWYGRVESRQTVTIVALEPSRVLSVDVEDQQHVEPGTPLFCLGGLALDNRLAAIREKVSALEQQLALASDTIQRQQKTIQAKTSSLRERVRLAQARLDQIAEINAVNVENIAARLALARTIVAGKQQDLENRIATRDAFDRARLEAMRLEAELEMAKQQTTTPEKDALLQLQADLEMAEIAAPNEAKASVLRLQVELKASSAELERLEKTAHVTAPIAGVFAKREVGVGQDIVRGTHLAAIIAPTNLRIVASLFPPPDVSLEGKIAMIERAGGDTITATVAKILPQRTPAGATLVWIGGDNVSRRLRSGETVSGTLVLLARKDALAVPDDAIVRDESEQPFVFLKAGGVFRKQAVETGLASNGWTEAVSGIPENAEIVVRGAYELFYRDFSKIYKVVD